MKTFAVSVTNDDVTAGIGPIKVSAKTAENAQAALARRNDTTVAQLAEQGLTVWMVTEL